MIKELNGYTLVFGPRVGVKLDISSDRLVELVPNMQIFCGRRLLRALERLKFLNLRKKHQRLWFINHNF